MTLSKQLYLIISFIFFMIFSGNFIISVNNFKNYLYMESTTKAQDTATYLGMSLKSIIDDKTDPEIKSIISAIANRGFYKEIRLENVEFNFSANDLITANDKLDSSYKIKDITVNSNDGEIIDSSEDDLLEQELSELENESLEEDSMDIKIYSFIPAKNFPKYKKITINYVAIKDNISINASSLIEINKVLVDIERVEKFENTPQWFIDILPMQMPEMKSEISNGWKTQAIIYVTANAGEAYSQLFEQVKGALYYALVSFSISIIMLIIFLRFLLKPLKDIESLAINISKGKFGIIKKLPWTIELKNVAISMNAMSNKIKMIIFKLNNNIELLTEELLCDKLTGLHQEQSFNSDMKHMFTHKEKNAFILYIKIDNFEEFTRDNKNELVDDFLKDFAKVLIDSDKDSKAYRFIGSTFVMISKELHDKKIRSIVVKIKAGFKYLSTKYNLLSIAHIGVTPFNHISTTEDILLLAHDSYEMAKQIGVNEFYIGDKNSSIIDMEEWKNLVSDIIDNNKFELKYTHQTLSTDGKNNILIEEIFTSVRDKESKEVPIGTFLSIAQEYHKVVNFDKAVIEHVISDIKTNKIKQELLINLTFDSLMDSSFIIWLEDILVKNKDISKQLLFSVTAYACVRDIEVFKLFISLVHRNGAKIVLKRYEIKFISLDTLKELNLDYIRLARDYTNGLIMDSTKQSFVESVCELSKLLNIKVLAESVKNIQCFNMLAKLGVYGVSMENNKETK